MHYGNSCLHRRQNSLQRNPQCNHPYPLLIHSSGANQADQLNRLIESRRLPRSSVRYDSVPIAAYSSVFVGPQDGLSEADKIAALPGQPEGVNFDQYSGYVTVDPKNGRALFYYFVESAQNSSSKPLVLWLNGGPGCSSFGNGAMTELGPFRVNSDGKTLTSHPYAWNEVANVIYLESPAGVGFSYSNTTSDYDKSGDQRTAADSYTFLINWLERFPQYKTRDFFITGESYAGHYIPQLAYTILQNNKVTNQTVINLKGTAIGNAYVDSVATATGRIDFYWNRAMISDETYAAIRENCNFSSNAESSACGNALSKADSELGYYDGYNIYAPLCNESGPPTSGNGGIGMASYDPCSGDYVYAYLNNPEVQKALHVNVPNIDWEPCSGLPWNDAPDSMLPTFKELINSGLYMWLYSGDIDSVIPITDTRYFFKMLGLPIKTPWRPWYFNSEVGGYVEEYEGLTLVTVRAAGHMVPRNQPERALTMFSSFLQGKLPPSS